MCYDLWETCHHQLPPIRKPHPRVLSCSSQSGWAPGRGQGQLRVLKGLGATPLFFLPLDPLAGCMYLLWVPALICLLRLPRAGETHRVGQSPLRCEGGGSWEWVCSIGYLGQDWGWGLCCSPRLAAYPIFITSMSDLKATWRGPLATVPRPKLSPPSLSLLRPLPGGLEKPFHSTSRFAYL